MKKKHFFGPFFDLSDLSQSQSLCNVSVRSDVLGI